MAQHSAWTVAAAILLIHHDMEDIPGYDFNFLEKMVSETGLSDLGQRGGKTPNKTLRTQLAKKTSVFSVADGGLFWLNNPKEAFENRQIHSAFKSYIFWLSQEKPKEFWSYFKHLKNNIVPHR